MVKLKENQVLEIFKMPGSQQKIANKYGVNQVTVSLIKRGITWGWLTKAA
jgi:DNA invertase Pin-like site-specific DNA recombinase